ncbi:ATP-binding cassette domain-containing protein [Arenibacter sp. 6A1]|uniref:ATP-binding cassette domain-containing protein n=1 Tax=Arenibacter sp. 6A1 TaxID=2720391 RepID=UPI0014450977|nr:ATP-binding cassette domain-containing protein [Arenibacter sp. 6A1]NKI27342.1 ATP-binding cassette domain-containing protein [Arenibacter sp. 6A1]
MEPKKHWAVFTDNSSKKSHFIHRILSANFPVGFEALANQKGLLFSKAIIDRYMDEEDRHDTILIDQTGQQSLRTMSSGEQKKALLQFLITKTPDFLILDNPFDNLDTDSLKDLKDNLTQLQHKISTIQLVSRRSDVFSFTTSTVRLRERNIIPYSEKDTAEGQVLTDSFFPSKIPAPLHCKDFPTETLIECRNISVDYSSKPILHAINWTIKKGEFWQLIGRNGSGKSTLLSMITGDNHKGYGQELYLFGRKKGSGESVWEIKENIGYYTPAMTDKFSGLHSARNMLISGLNDSIGLYLYPTENQLNLAKQWLQLLGMWELRNVNFYELTLGQQRLIMAARAMIKHPPLLILDEPTAGLDDRSAALFVSLVNKIAEESQTAIIFVSHRKEPGLLPHHFYQLSMTPQGSIGEIL